MTIGHYFAFMDLGLGHGQNLPALAEATAEATKGFKVILYRHSIREDG
jgi:hypothetical protein